MASRQGPPKHQNSVAWKPNAGCKINETEPGGRFRPLSAITGVCPRCKDQIDWKRRYGKYKPLTEPAKCVRTIGLCCSQRCGKRNVRQAYHSVCSGCAKENKVCAKCLCRVEQIVGRDIEEVEAEKRTLDEAIKNARERDRRSLLRAMSKNKNSGAVKTSAIGDGSREGQLFSASTLDEYAELSRHNDGNHDHSEDKLHVK